MNRRLILITVLFFTSSAFAGNWFVGGGGGTNWTKSTPTGYLPMAYEGFGINGFDSKDAEEIERIINSGGTFDDYAHLMVLRLGYSSGIEAGIEAGYMIRHFKVILNIIYMRATYDYIEDTSQQTFVNILKAGAGSGETNLWSGLLMGEYSLPLLRNTKFDPVVGAGLGVARAQDVLNFDGKKITRQQAVFVYKVKLGVNYNFTKHLQGNIETAFFGTGNKIKATNNYLKQGQLNIGVRWIFD